MKFSTEAVKYSTEGVKYSTEGAKYSAAGVKYSTAGAKYRTVLTGHNPRYYDITTGTNSVACGQGVMIKIRNSRIAILLGFKIFILHLNSSDLIIQ